MDTYESILLIMIGIVVIWDKILKPLNQRGSARKAVWEAKAERKIKAMDQIWEAQKRLEQMQHIFVSGIMMWKDSPDIRKIIMEKTQCGSTLPPLNVEYLNKMTMASETPDEARTYVGEEFWNAWENYKGFIIASHTGPVLEKRRITACRKRCRMVQRHSNYGTIEKQST